MILHYPTGMYATVLPKVPSDAGNVTFTISNNVPPRTNLIYPKITSGISDRKRTRLDTSLSERRAPLGELVYSISDSSRALEGNNSRQYEVGQILEFVTATTRTLVPMLVAPDTEIRHDTNLYDYNVLGLTAAELNIIEITSLTTKDDITTRLNQIRMQRADAEYEIQTLQKTINEADRNIAALNVIADNSAETAHEILALITKLEQARNNAKQQQTDVVASANALAVEASDLQDQLRTLSLVVK